MARKPRIEFYGAFYHVITRGNQRQKIFRDEQDFKRYLEILRSYKQRYRYSLHSYVLMSNHVHLLIETGEVPLFKIIQGINQSFTMYFNRKYRTIGHLFQGRYKAILCDKDRYLLALIKYIHSNPVRAKIVQNLDEYPWSGHHYYERKTAKDDLVDVDQALRMFSEDKTTTRKLYQNFIGEGTIKKDDIYKTIDQRLLGDEQFVERVMEHYDGEVAQRRREKEFTLGKIAEGINLEIGIALKEIRGKNKGQDKTTGRRLFCLVADEYGYRGREIADYIKKDPAIVTRDLKTKDYLSEEMEKVITMLKKDKIVNSQV